MPLHDWRDERGWGSLQMVWQRLLIEWIQPRLPGGYRASVGAVPALTIDSMESKPIPTPMDTPTDMAAIAPDAESIATLTLDPHYAIHIDVNGHLIAALELVLPRNKDCPESRERYTNRYLGYLHNGVHLMIIDVLPLPAGFSFADMLATSLQIDQALCTGPFALSYRVGDPVPHGTHLARWLRPLQVGQPLPTIPLPLDSSLSLALDLERTYSEAARQVHLE